MAHSIARIKSSLVNTPHLIEQSSFESIMEYVNKRMDNGVEITKPEASIDNHRYVPENATGVMHITGPLTYKTSGWEALCGGTSYEMLKDQMDYFVAQEAKTVAMLVDSGGGEAHGMMDSANYIRKLADENGIKIIAYVDGYSASAAYGISCIADEIVSASDSLIGSIGVLIQLMNNSKQLEKAGIERTFITAGDDKVPFDADGSFTDSFKERLQNQVDTLYEGFTGHVAEHRGLDIAAVKGTQANVFMASEALELGLIDKVMTVEDFYNYLGDVAQNNIEENNMGIKDAFKLTNKGDKAEMAQLEELNTLLQAETQARALADSQLAAQATQLADMQAALTAATAQLEEFKTLQAAAAEAEALAAVEKRKAALADVVPATELESYMTNMSSLEDGAFTFMVTQLKAAKDARAASFKELGEEGAEDDSDDNEPDAIEAIRLAGIERAKQLRR